MLTADMLSPDMLSLDTLSLDMLSLNIFRDSHTGRFWVELFQNYGFKEWIFLKDLKLWLFVLTKTLF